MSHVWHELCVTLCDITYVWHESLPTHCLTNLCVTRFITYTVRWVWHNLCVTCFMTYAVYSLMCNTHRNTHCNTHCNPHCNTHCNTQCNTHCNTRPLKTNECQSESLSLFLYCNTLQHILQHILHRTATHPNILQHILQRTATHCHECLPVLVLGDSTPLPSWRGFIF